VDFCAANNAKIPVIRPARTFSSMVVCRVKERLAAAFLGFYARSAADCQERMRLVMTADTGFFSGEAVKGSGRASPRLPQKHRKNNRTPQIPLAFYMKGGYTLFISILGMLRAESEFLDIPVKLPGANKNSSGAQKNLSQGT
jgi:hypothetical protein